MEKHGIKHVTRNTLSKQVMEQIVQLIESGQIKPGEKLLTEFELMEKLGVSRPVVREALSSLEALEIINKSPRGGTYINEKIGSTPFRTMLSINSLNIEAIIEARMVLELGLVTIAAKKITEQELGELESTINNIINTVGDDYGEQDKKFHKIIASSVNNPVLEGMIESLLVVHNKIDSLIKIRDREITTEHHKKIYEALKERNPEKAYKAMYEHLLFVRDKILNK